MIDLERDCLICFDQSPKGLRGCAENRRTCGPLVRLGIGQETIVTRLGAAQRRKWHLIVRLIDDTIHFFDDHVLHVLVNQISNYE